MKPLLLISNGHGEDIIGATLGRALQRLGYAAQAVPLVGQGLAYQRAGIPTLGPCKALPSGGFALQSAAAVWADIRAGWVAMSRAQYRAVRTAAREARATLVVGDVYALGVGWAFASRPLFLMQCRSSLRVGGRPYSVTERLLMRQTVRVYPREPEGETWLKARGVPQACYLGNPMLDALDDGPLEVTPPYLLLLPGSREDAYQSLPLMLEACRLLGPTGLAPLVAWAGQPLEKLPISGWALESTGQAQGPTHRLRHPDGTLVYLTQGAFKTALLGSRLALSTSGTAAEQAAGYGVPLVGFPTQGPQYTLGFAKTQKRLLGDALTLSEPSPKAIAWAAQRLLSSETLLKRAITAGKAAMGEPGAAARVALDIHQHLQAIQPASERCRYR